MSYIKRLDRAFKNAPVLPVNRNTKYVFFSDCHRGIGNNNDNFLKNSSSYFAALQYYFQNGFCYIEAGDGDELWENCSLKDIIDIHSDIFSQLFMFHKSGRLYMLYGNHDIIKKNFKTPFNGLKFYEGIILKSENPPINIRVTHGHQVDIMNSSFWRINRFLVRYLWAPLEYFGVSDPTNAAKNNTKKDKVERRLADYAKNSGCMLITGHTHRPALGSLESPYFNCGSCVHPKCVTCIELCHSSHNINGCCGGSFDIVSGSRSYTLNLVKWHGTAEKTEYFSGIYSQYPPAYPVYIKCEVISSISL